MKKKLALALAAGTVAAGAGGFFLRRWQLDTAFEADTGLLTPGMPATYALAALAAVAAAALLALSWAVFRGKAPDGYLANLAAPNLAVGVATLAAGAMLFAGGALGIRDYALRMDPSVTRLVLGCCMTLCGVCVGLVGLLGQQRREGKGRFFGALPVPGYCACVWLIAAYQGHTANPNIMEYVFLLLGIVCAVLACYAGASFSFERPRPVLCAFSSALGAALLVIAAADRPWGMDGLLVAGYALYLLVQLTCLIACKLRPPQLETWTPPGPGQEREQHEPRGEEHE